MKPTLAQLEAARKYAMASSGRWAEDAKVYAAEEEKRAADAALFSQFKAEVDAENAKRTAELQPRLIMRKGKDGKPEAIEESKEQYASFLSDQKKKADADLESVGGLTGHAIAIFSGDREEKIKAAEARRNAIDARYAQLLADSGKVPERSVLQAARDSANSMFATGISGILGTAVDVVDPDTTGLESQSAVTKVVDKLRNPAISAIASIPGLISGDSTVMPRQQQMVLEAADTALGLAAKGRDLLSSIGGFDQEKYGQLLRATLPFEQMQKLPQDKLAEFRNLQVQENQRRAKAGLPSIEEENNAKWSTQLAGYLDEEAEKLRADKSLTSKVQDVLAGRAMQQGLRSTIEYAKDNPFYVAEKAIESSPYLLAGGPASSALRTAGAGELIAATGSATAIGALDVAQGAKEAKSSVNAVQMAELAKSEAFQKLKAANPDATPAQLREVLAQAAETKALGVGLPLTAIFAGVSTRLGFNPVEAATAGVGQRVTPKNFVTSIIKEAAGEFPEEAGNQWSQNLGEIAGGVRAPDKEMEGVLGAGAMGAMAGGATSAGVSTGQAAAIGAERLGDIRAISRMEDAAASKATADVRAKRQSETADKPQSAPTSATAEESDAAPELMPVSFFENSVDRTVEAQISAIPETEGDMRAFADKAKAEYKEYVENGTSMSADTAEFVKTVMPEYKAAVAPKSSDEIRAGVSQLNSDIFAINEAAGPNKTLGTVNDRVLNRISNESDYHVLEAFANQQLSKAVSTDNVIAKKIFTAEATAAMDRANAIKSSLNVQPSSINSGAVKTATRKSSRIDISEDGIGKELDFDISKDTSYTSSGTDKYGTTSYYQVAEDGEWVNRKYTNKKFPNRYFESESEVIAALKKRKASKIPDDSVSLSESPPAAKPAVETAGTVAPGARVNQIRKELQSLKAQPEQTTEIGQKIAALEAERDAIYSSRGFAAPKTQSQEQAVDADEFRGAWRPEEEVNLLAKHNEFMKRLSAASDPDSELQSVAAAEQSDVPNPKATAKRFKDMKFTERWAIAKQLRETTSSSEFDAILEAIGSGNLMLRNDPSTTVEGVITKKAGKIIVNMAEFVGKKGKSRRESAFDLKKEANRSLTIKDKLSKKARKEKLQAFYLANFTRFVQSSSSITDAIRHEFTHAKDLFSNTDMVAVNDMMANNPLWAAATEYVNVNPATKDKSAEDKLLEVNGYYMTALSSMANDPQFAPLLATFEESVYAPLKELTTFVTSGELMQHWAAVLDGYTSEDTLQSATRVVNVKARPLSIKTGKEKTGPVEKRVLTLVKAKNAIVSALSPSDELNAYDAILSIIKEIEEDGAKANILASIAEDTYASRFIADATAGLTGETRADLSLLLTDLLNERDIALSSVLSLPVYSPDKQAVKKYLADKAAGKLDAANVPESVKPINSLWKASYKLRSRLLGSVGGIASPGEMGEAFRVGILVDDSENNNVSITVESLGGVISSITNGVVLDGTDDGYVKAAKSVTLAARAAGLANHRKLVEFALTALDRRISKLAGKFNKKVADQSQLKRELEAAKADKDIVEALDSGARITLSSIDALVRASLSDAKMKALAYEYKNAYILASAGITAVQTGPDAAKAFLDNVYITVSNPDQGIESFRVFVSDEDAAIDKNLVVADGKYYNFNKVLESMIEADGISPRRVKGAVYVRYVFDSLLAISTANNNASVLPSYKDSYGRNKLFGKFEKLEYLDPWTGRTVSTDGTSFTMSEGVTDILADDRFMALYKDAVIDSVQSVKTIKNKPLWASESLYELADAYGTSYSDVVDSVESQIKEYNTALSDLYQVAAMNDVKSIIDELNSSDTIPADVKETLNDFLTESMSLSSAKEEIQIVIEGLERQISSLEAALDDKTVTDESSDVSYDTMAPPSKVSTAKQTAAPLSPKHSKSTSPSRYNRSYGDLKDLMLPKLENDNLYSWLDVRSGEEVLMTHEEARAAYGETYVTTIEENQAKLESVIRSVASDSLSGEFTGSSERISTALAKYAISTGQDSFIAGNLAFTLKNGRFVVESAASTQNRRRVADLTKALSIKSPRMLVKYISSNEDLVKLLGSSFDSVVKETVLSSVESVKTADSAIRGMLRDKLSEAEALVVNQKAQLLGKPGLSVGKTGVISRITASGRSPKKSKSSFKKLGQSVPAQQQDRVVPEKRKYYGPSRPNRAYLMRPEDAASDSLQSASGSFSGIFKHIRTRVAADDVNALTAMIADRATLTAVKTAAQNNAFIGPSVRNIVNRGAHRTINMFKLRTDGYMAKQSAVIGAKVAMMNKAMDTAGIEQSARTELLDLLISIDENYTVQAMKGISKNALINRYRRLYGDAVLEVFDRADELRQEVDSAIDRLAKATLGQYTYDTAPLKVKNAYDALIASKQRYLHRTYHKFSISSGRLWKSQIDNAIDAIKRDGPTAIANSSSHSAKAHAAVLNAANTIIDSWNKFAERGTPIAHAFKQVPGNWRLMDDQVKLRTVLEMFQNDFMAAAELEITNGSIDSLSPASKNAGALKAKKLDGPENKVFRELLGENRDYGRVISETIENQLVITMHLEMMRQLRHMGILVDKKEYDSMSVAQRDLYVAAPSAGIFSAFSSSYVLKDYEYAVTSPLPKQSIAKSIREFNQASKNGDYKGMAYNAMVGSYNAIATTFGLLKMFTVFTSPALWASLFVGMASFSSKSMASPETMLKAAKIADMWKKNQAGAPIDENDELYNDFMFIMGTETIDSAVFAELTTRAKDSDYEAALAQLDTNGRLVRDVGFKTAENVKDYLIATWTKYEAIPKVAAALAHRDNINAYNAALGKKEVSPAFVGNIVRREFPSAKDVPAIAKFSDSIGVTMFAGFYYQTIKAGSWGIGQNLNEGVQMYRNAGDNQEAKGQSVKFIARILAGSAAQFATVATLAYLARALFEMDDDDLTEEQRKLKKAAEATFTTTEDPDNMIHIGFHEDGTPIFVDVTMMINPLDVRDALFRRSYDAMSSENKETLGDVLFDQIPYGFVGQSIRNYMRGMSPDKNANKAYDRLTNAGMLRYMNNLDEFGFAPGEAGPIAGALANISGIKKVDPAARLEFLGNQVYFANKDLGDKVTDVIHDGDSYNKRQMQDEIGDDLEYVQLKARVYFDTVNDAFKKSGMSRSEFIKVATANLSEDKAEMVAKDIKAALVSEGEDYASERAAYSAKEIKDYYNKEVKKGLLATDRKGPLFNASTYEVAAATRNKTSFEAIIDPKTDIKPVKGTVTGVHDADTVYVTTDTGRQVKVRVQNIDAFELKQKLRDGSLNIGQEGQRFLSGLLRDRQVTLFGYGYDDNGRMVARVLTKDGKDAGIIVAEEGYAILTDISDLDEYPTKAEKMDADAPSVYRQRDK